MKDLCEYEIGADKFWSWVKVGADDECWEWGGACNTTGYGLFSVKSPYEVYERTGRLRTQLIAHRVAYYISNGAIDNGKQVCHSCDNRRCCNPDHLWLGTALDNVLDMISKGRAHWQR